jgi:SulP family sulfate permease
MVKWNDVRFVGMIVRRGTISETPFLSRGIGEGTFCDLENVSCCFMMQPFKITRHQQRGLKETAHTEADAVCEVVHTSRKRPEKTVRHALFFWRIWPPVRSVQSGAKTREDKNHMAHAPVQGTEPGISIWISRIQAGILGGAMAVTFAIGHAALITGSSAPTAAAAAVSMTVTGTAVLCLVLGFLSQARGIIPSSQDVPAASLGAIVAALAAQGNLGSPPDPATLVALILATTLAFALCFFVFGYLRLGKLIRFAPQPMVAGFLAGTGWFVFVGAIGICAGLTITLDTLDALIEPTARAKISVAVGVAILISVISRILQRGIALSVVLIGTVIAFHMVTWALGYSQNTLTADGWFAEVTGSGSLWPPVPLAELRGVDLYALRDALFPMITMVLLATMALLMNASALELEMRRDLPLDGELRALGAANLASALSGGVPGYHGVATTVTGFRISAPHRSVSFTAGAVALAVLALGNDILPLLPMPILAGFMISVGASLLWEWLICPMWQLTRKDALLTLAIFVVIAGVGLFEGTVFGLFAGSLLFVLDYSRRDPVKSQFGGDTYHGSREMSHDRLALLQTYGSAVQVVRIQGFLFFGTAHRLRERLRERLRQYPETETLILDFEAVTGLDATAVNSFLRIAQDLSDLGVAAELAALSGEVRVVMVRSGIENEGNITFCEDLDAALTRAEERLIVDNGLDPVQETYDVRDLLQMYLDTPEQTATIVEQLSFQDLKSGEKLFVEGSRGRDLHFILEGKMAVMRATAAGNRRLRWLEPGAVVGELAFYLDSPRTAGLMADGPVRVATLTYDAVETLTVAHPQLIARLHQGLARALAARVEANTRLIETLRA